MLRRRAHQEGGVRCVTAPRPAGICTGPSNRVRLARMPGESTCNGGLHRRSALATVDEVRGGLEPRACRSEVAGRTREPMSQLALCLPAYLMSCRRYGPSTFSRIRRLASNPSSNCSGAWRRREPTSGGWLRRARLPRKPKLRLSASPNTTGFTWISSMELHRRNSLFGAGGSRSGRVRRRSGRRRAPGC